MEGSDITKLGLDSRGRYEVHSKMKLRPKDMQTLTVEMKQEVLNLSYSHAITLHPLPGFYIDSMYCRF
ncbi:hypothetical protein AAFF_G00126630 [Aldrovandia affinis]|uniref:Uncharacterized protein n=1 Tax=Aldrovandia affinis TaxID=143900 RepID=A0AAD7RRC3_9TELE|nr:hypothetical protein AAFF_G00126630 [Aldrovandia affinis]